jgi:selenide,water dikinase
VDFFPPIVDDPRWYGRIAAANALSDVYAMGGRALTALNIVGWPKELELEVLGEILAGGLEKIREAGAALCGGHTVSDSEVKYGLAVTGLVHPERFWANSGGKVGDALLLTKPLGMGVVSTAIKQGKAAPEVVAAAMAQMATLNKAACEAMADVTVHGATDVTGFGLMGHAFEMASGARATLRIRADAVPLAEGAIELARAGMLSGGCKRGRAYLDGKVSVGAGVDPALADVMFDAETSGGLLLAVPAARAAAAQRRLRDAQAPCAAVIGEIVPPAGVAVAVD